LPNIKELLVNNKIPVKEDISIKKIYNGKSKCFDCERQVNQTNKSEYNLVHPTKCFDCERQITKNYNNNRSNLGHSSKCFSCEN